MNRSALSPIENRVVKHLQTSFSGETSSKFVVGVSGGPDSMALLHIFNQLEVQAVVIHINYQKRGEESDRDQELVEKMAEGWGYDCHSIRLDPSRAEDKNFQQWARDRRYRIFRQLKGEYEADAIAVAHHEDDQIETVLQKLFRGAGLESWSGMQVWSPPLFRPLLDISREQVMEYINENDIPYRTDQSNLESDFARNLLRNEWLDKLDQFFPGWKQNVLRLPEQALIFTEALTYIEDEIADSRDRIDSADFNRLSPRLQKALVLHLLKKRDPGIEITTGALNQVEDIANLQTGKSIQLTENYSLLHDRSQLKIVYEETEPLTLIELEKEELKKQSFSFNGLSFSVQSYNDPDFEEILYLDAGKMNWPLSLRRWKAGDAFQPFGMVGHQNVSDHLTNRKVSASEKRNALVLESFEERICAVIFPPIEKMNPPGSISELVKCDENTSECLMIKRNR